MSAAYQPFSEDSKADESQPRQLSRPILALVGILIVVACFRASQNGAQTSAALLAHDVLSMNANAIGLAAMVSGISATVVNVLLVARASHSSVKATLVGLLALFVALALFAGGNLALTYFLASVTLGVAGGLLMPSLATLVSSISGVTRQRAIALFTIALSASLALGPLYESGVLLVEGDSIRRGFLAFLPFPVIAVLIVLWIRRGRGVLDRATLQAKRSKTRSLYSNKGLRLALNAQVIYQVPFVALVGFGALFARVDYGLGAASAEIAFTVFFLASLGTRLALAVVLIRGRHLLLLQLSMLVTLVALVMISLGHSWLWLVISMVALGIPHGVTYPVALDILSLSMPADQLSRANAVLSGFTNVVTIVVPAFAGYLAQSMGLRSMFWVVAVFVLLGSIPLFRDVRGRSTALFHGGV